MKQLNVSVTAETRFASFEMETDMLWKTSLSYQPIPICTSESLGDGHLRREDALGALGTAGLGETAETEMLQPL